jgi:bifunctional non-homologous end joining protein LigD
MDKLLFVIHKHQATALHYDFRIQVGKSMPSWAIPKGLTLDPKFKRLSVKVGDHDLEYRNFEGNIPEGHVGGGPVMIWDEGYYEAEREKNPGVREIIKDFKEAENEISEGIKKGEIKFFLHGKKVKGSFALIKTKNFPPGSTKDSWLLIKHKDEYCKEDYDAKNEDFSARTGKSLKEIKDSE